MEPVGPRSVDTGRVPPDIMQTAVIHSSGERRQDLPADVMKRVKITPDPSRDREIEELMKGLRNAQYYGKNAILAVYLVCLIMMGKSQVVEIGNYLLCTW